MRRRWRARRRDDERARRELVGEELRGDRRPGVAEPRRDDRQRSGRARPSAQDVRGDDRDRHQPSAIAIGPAPAWAVVRSGAAQAIPPTPTRIAATAPYSRRPGVSPSRVTPSQSSSTSPQARHGWTTVRGASSSAAISSGQPSSPISVASSQRGS